MRIALIGSHGFIASQLNQIWNRKYNIIGFARRPLSKEIFFDLEQIDKIDFTHFDRFDVALFLAANSSIESCQYDYKAAKLVNVDATIYSIQQIISRKCRVIFFSSDAVYGKTEKPAYENTECHPISNYGKMKKEVETAIKSLQFAKIVRLSYVFSYYDKFTQYYLSCVKRYAIPQIYNPFSRSIITILDLSKLLEWLIETWLSIDVINACGNRLISRIDLAESVDKALKINTEREIIDIPAKFTKYRPAILDMRSHYIPTYLPSLYSDDFLNKVSQEFARVGKLL